MALLRGTSKLAGSGEFTAFGDHQDDAFLRPLCRRAAEMTNIEPTGFVEQATWSVAEFVLGENAAQEAKVFGRTAAWLGYNARKAECEALGVDETAGAIRRVIDTFRAEHPARHWYDIVIYSACDMGAVLMTGGERDLALLENTLPPGGMPRGTFARYHDTLLVQLMVTPDNKRVRKLENIGAEQLNGCWHCGYMLRACDADLPPAARAAMDALPG